MSDKNVVHCITWTLGAISFAEDLKFQFVPEFDQLHEIKIFSCCELSGLVPQIFTLSNGILSSSSLSRANTVRKHIYIGPEWHAVRPLHDAVVTIDLEILHIEIFKKRQRLWTCHISDEIFHINKYSICPLNSDSI